MASSKYQLIRAALTWVGDRFERHIQVLVQGDKIVKLICEGEKVDEEVEVVELTEEALIPGFVNCHSHAFQRELRGLGETFDNESFDTFWTWRQEMYKLVDKIEGDDAFYSVTKKCFDEMKRAGITSVGEFHYFHHSKSEHFGFDKQVIRAARDAQIRLVLLSTFYAYGGFLEKPLNETQKRFETKTVDEYWNQMDSLQKSIEGESLVSLGVVAHSLRAVSLAQLKDLNDGAAQRGYPFHIHIEEQPKEVEECIISHRKPPMRVLLDTIPNPEITTAVHCNHTEVDHLKEFASKGGKVCICPLTEGNLGDGVMKDFGACARSVCLGTDCNARIDMLEELRWLEYSQRLSKISRGVCAKAAGTARGDATSSSGKELLQMAFENGASSLHLPVGKISPGFFADFATIDLTSPQLNHLHARENVGDILASAIIFGASGSQVVKRTCVGGQWSM